MQDFWLEFDRKRNGGRRMGTVALECRRQCGFYTHSDYFSQKKRFTAGVCPKCSGPVDIVDSDTRAPIAGASFVTDRSQGSYGEVVGVQLAGTS